jgi:uncharacterized protein (UPF0332 family)
MSAEDYMAKAERALAAAHKLFDGDQKDPEGAANRLYYAMFGAARAALTAVGQPKAASGSHGTVIGQFGLHLVQTGMVSSDLGRALKEAQELRAEGDYGTTVPDLDSVAEFIQLADRFVEAVRTLIPPKPGP